MFELKDLPADDLDATADQRAAEAPEPQQHAIDQAQSDAAAAGDTASAVELDALGIPWDESIHAKGSDGKGVRTAQGTWRKRRGLKGSASYIGGRAKATAPSPEDPEATQRKTLEAQSRLAGAMVAQTMIHISAGIGGHAFLPKDIQLAPGVTYNEKDMLVTAWGDYFVAKGVVDVPPGVALTGALFMYYAPRFREPEVRKRASGIVAWFKDRAEWVYLKIKHRGKKVPAQSKSRSNSDADNVSPFPRNPSIADV